MKSNLFGKEAQVNEFDKKCSLLLANAIQEKHLTKRRVKLKTWMPFFEKLRHTDDIEKERILKVLNWLILHLRDKNQT